MMLLPIQPAAPVITATGGVAANAPVLPNLTERDRHVRNSRSTNTTVHPTSSQSSHTSIGTSKAGPLSVITFLWKSLTVMKSDNLDASPSIASIASIVFSIDGSPEIDGAKCE